MSRGGVLKPLFPNKRAVKQLVQRPQGWPGAVAGLSRNRLQEHQLLVHVLRKNRNQQILATRVCCTATILARLLFSRLKRGHRVSMLAQRQQQPPLRGALKLALVGQISEARCWRWRCGRWRRCSRLCARGEVAVPVPAVATAGQM
jgi:hypothetical protein